MLGIEPTTYFRGILSHITEAILAGFGSVLRRLILSLIRTLYSFRHTGATEIFKRTGSITTLQKAMGHSSLNVSLTYLRGLEVAELKEEDMPMV